MEPGETRELLEHVVINEVAAPSQYMLNSELLQTQHGLVVDISGSEFIPVNYAADELIGQDLTEEDRNLAAALVAVQLSQQQKQNQQQPILHEAVATGNTLPPISLLDKTASNGYLQIVGSDNIYVEKQPLPKLADSSRFSAKPPTPTFPFDETSGMTLTSVKTEEEKKDSDGESVRNETRSSKKSLPHKKRISRKLKKTCPPNAKKITCNLCEQDFSASEFHQHEILCQTTITPVNPMNFNCQLCNSPFTDQLRFFEHLKKHYEPPSNKDPSTVPSKKEKKSPTPEPVQKLKQEPGKSGWTAEADASSSPVVDSETVVQPAADVAKGNQQQESLLSSLLCLTCIECNKTFRRQKTFEQHMRDVHTPKEESQNDEFSEPEDFMVGINVVVNDNDPTSDYDNGDVDEDSKAWYKEEDLHQAEEDLKEMEESNGHVCHLCNQPFPLRAILLQHLVTCRVINADAEPVNPAPSPKKKTNKKKGNLQCTECDRTFIHRNSLVYHMRSHTGIRPHQCDQCGKSFFASSALKVHLRLHSGDKPYSCTECDKKFRQWGDLKYHMTSIHSNEKNFQCEYCGKEFARKYSLIVHRRIHTGEKNYKCEFCNKTFRASSYLQNHRRIHTGEKPHACDICLKPFRVRSDMKRHMKTHNRIPPGQLANAQPKVQGTVAGAGTVVIHHQEAEYVHAKEENSDEENTAELHIGGDEDDPSHQILEYEPDTLDPSGRELAPVRMTNRTNMYINGNELFLVTYPS